VKLSKWIVMGAFLTFCVVSVIFLTLLGQVIMTRWFLRPVLYALLILCSLFFLMPVYVMLVTSLKPLREVTLERMWSLPSTIDFSSYQIAFEKLAPNLMNSLYLVIPATLLSAVLGAMNGYVLSKWRFKGSEVVFTLMLFGIFIPYQSILIPLIQFLREVGLYNSSGFDHRILLWSPFGSSQMCGMNSYLQSR